MTSPRIHPLPRERRDPAIEEVLAGLRLGPNGGDLNVFATLAHHPKLLKRWAAFGAVLLYGGHLSDRDRELLILRTCWHCEARYEWAQHVDIARSAGLSDEEIERIVVGPDAPGWSRDDAGLLQAADELHARSCISDHTWADLAARFDEAELIELCMVVGQYHLVAFTLNSLGVEPERERGLPTRPEPPPP